MWDWCGSERDLGIWEEGRSITRCCLQGPGKWDSFVCMVGGWGGGVVGWSSWESRDTRIHVSMPLNAMNCQCYSAEEKVNVLDKGQFCG